MDFYLSSRTVALCLLAIVFLYATPAFADNVAVVTGSTAGGPVWTRPTCDDALNCTASSLGVNVPYQSTPFRVDTDGSYDFQSSQDSFDGVLLLFAGSFNPTNTAYPGIAGYNDDDQFNAGSTKTSSFSATLSAGVQYHLVTTGFETEDAGSFTNTITGPAGSNITLAPLPVELIDFKVVASGTDAVLRWTTATEIDNAGFEVQMRTKGLEAFEVLDFVEGHLTTSRQHDYAYRAIGLDPGTYTFRLKQIDLDGAFEFSPEVQTIISTPSTHLISSAYPNPFTTSSRFTLTVGRTQHVKLGVFDVRGRLVVPLHDGPMEENTTYRFQVDGSTLPNGLFVLRAAGEYFTASEKLVLLR